MRDKASCTRRKSVYRKEGAETKTMATGTGSVDVNSEILRKQVMVNQMVNAVGCTPEQATTILQRAQWHLEVSSTLSERLE